MVGCGLPDATTWTIKKIKDSYVDGVAYNEIKMVDLDYSFNEAKIAIFKAKFLLSV